MASFGNIKAPWTVKIAVDFDLIDLEETGVVEIFIYEKMTKENYKTLIPFDDPKDGFKTAVIAYECDICKKQTSNKNPIYTNRRIQGNDVCTKCMDKAFQTIEHIERLRPGPVYRMKHIFESVKNN